MVTFNSKYMFGFLKFYSYKAGAFRIICALLFFQKSPIRKTVNELENLSWTQSQLLERKLRLYTGNYDFCVVTKQIA